MIQCLECGKWYRSVGDHVRMCHGMTARDYKIAHGLPLKKSLACEELKEKRRKKAIKDNFRGKGTDIQENIKAMKEVDYNFKLSTFRQRKLFSTAHAARSKLGRNWTDEDFLEFERRAEHMSGKEVSLQPDMPSYPTYLRWKRKRL